MKIPDIPQAPQRIALLGDISVTVRPLSTADMAICQAAARRRIDEIAQSLDDCQEAGFIDGVSFDPEDPDQREGLYQDQLIKEIAVRHIVSWEGVFLGGSDEVAEVTPENIRAVFDHFVLAETFFQKITIYHRALLAAKKGSGVALPGTSGTAAAPNTADNAEKTTTPAARGKRGLTASVAHILKTLLKPIRKLQPGG